MFKSYHYIGYDGKYGYLYKLIDDDFEEEISVGASYLNAAGIMISIMDLYTKRDLPIAPNVIRYMLYIATEEYGFSLDNQVKWQKKHNPRWHEIEKDMQMYLLFS
jgi:hypothetical protein